MGLMRFIVSPPDRITEDSLQRIYLSGMDRVPWVVRARRNNQELVLERAVSDSGNLHVPWPVEGYGCLTLSTGTLRERAEPYHLPLELARGKIGQVRNQLSDWRSIGLIVPENLESRINDAVRCLGKAVIGDRTAPESVALAEKAIRLALDAGHLLATCYTEQALTVRRRLAHKLGTSLGANLGSTLLDEFTGQQFLQTFNAATVPLNWRDIETTESKYFWDVSDRQVEWCRVHNLAVTAGPLLQFDERSIPTWLYLCEGDFENVLSFVSEFVEAVVKRYRGKVAVWQCAGRVNTGDILGLGEEEKVKLAAKAIEIVRTLDPDAKAVISFDQPWAEYLSRQGKDFPPLHFADALLRAGLGLTGLALELNVSYFPGGTLPRDLLDFSRQVDYWSMLGVPLYLLVTVPSASHADPLAQRPATLLDGWTPTAQQAWVSRYIPLLLAKPSVQGVYWNQLRDAEPHCFPHGGLFDLRRHPKPALGQLATLRQTHLK